MSIRHTECSYCGKYLPPVRDEIPTTYKYCSRKCYDKHKKQLEDEE